MKSETMNMVSDGSLMNAPGKVNKSEYGKILETEKVEETPFHIVTVDTLDGKKTFIAIGNNRISKLYDSKNDAVEQIDNKEWDLITSLITIITERVSEQLELERKLK